VQFILGDVRLPRTFQVLAMTKERRLRMTPLVAFIRGKGYNRGMRDLIADAVKGYGADYIEIHYIALGSR
jgi:hypothetical protein